MDEYYLNRVKPWTKKDVSANDIREWGDRALFHLNTMLVTAKSKRRKRELLRRIAEWQGYLETIK